MSDAALHGLALLLAILGMGLFALSLTAHWRQVSGRAPLEPRAKRALRGVGGVALALSFAVCLAADPASMAVLVWTTLLTIAAGLTAAALAVQARLTAR